MMTTVFCLISAPPSFYDSQLQRIKGQVWGFLKKKICKIAVKSGALLSLISKAPGALIMQNTVLFIWIVCRHSFTNYAIGPKRPRTFFGHPVFSLYLPVQLSFTKFSAHLQEPFVLNLEDYKMISFTPWWLVSFSSSLEYTVGQNRKKTRNK